jgi:Family of unknown function (DUF5985)
MASLVYLLGTVVTLLCAILLLRAYHGVRMKLLLWSGLCFVGLTVSNALLCIDLILLPEAINLYMWRLASAAGAMLLLIYGLVFESE